jgi:tetratricopeptide (TPR) repeat protein
MPRSMFACNRFASRLLAPAVGVSCFRGALGVRGVLRVFVAAALLCAMSGTAAAQAGKAADPPRDNKALAKEHFQRGTSFYDLGRYNEAIREFEAAYQLKNDPAFLYNLAQSYRLAGNPERALHFYRTYLRYVPKAPNRAEIEERIAALERSAADKASTQTAPPPVVTTPPPTTTTPPPATTTPPTTAPPTGTTPPSGTTAPETTTVTPPPFAPPPAPPSEPAPAPTDTRARLAPKIVFGGRIAVGVGAGMFLIGVIQGLRASAASNQVEDVAEAGGFFDPAVERRGKSAESAQWWWIGLGTLVAAAGGGAWYYGLRMQANAESSKTAAGSSWPRLTFGPIAGPGRAGGLLQVRF